MTQAVADVLLAVLLPPLALIVIAGGYWGVRCLMMRALVRKLRKPVQR